MTGMRPPLNPNFTSSKLDRYGFDSLTVGTCGTCTRKGVRVVVLGFMPISLCSDCLVDLANIVAFDPLT